MSPAALGLALPSGSERLLTWTPLLSADGIDWSRRETDKLVTASLDKSFKTWNWKQPERAELSVHTASPVWRARFLPFGAGMLTLPQRSDHALSIWSKEQVERGPIAQPIARFEGARGGVKEFVWRIKGGADLDNGRSNRLKLNLVAGLAC